MLAILAVAAAQEATAAPGDQNWDSRFGLAPGLDGPVKAFAVIGTNLFVAGDFTRIGAQPISSVARWDGTKWYPLGSSVGGPYVSVRCLATDGTNLYVGGSFTIAGGIAATNIARWDGQSWSALGSGIVSPIGGAAFIGENGEVVFELFSGVESLIVRDAKLYAGGSIVSAGGVAVTNIAVWDGAQWSSLGAGLQGSDYYGGYGGGASSLGTVKTLIFQGTNLYAGGYFQSSGSTATTNIARWDGFQWHSLGDGTTAGFGEHVSALALKGDQVLVGGRFTGAGVVTTTNLAWWNGAAWNVFPTDNQLTPTGFIADQSGVVVFGKFAAVGGVSSSAIARFDGTNWTGYGSGITGELNAAAWLGTNLYVGGRFQVAGGKSAGFIARWDGHGWQSLFSGKGGALFGSVIRSLTANTSGAYVAGNLVSAGETPVNSVAHFNGTNWMAMDQGLSPNRSHRLASVQTNLYVMESDVQMFGVPTVLKRWNGFTWEIIPLGLTNNGSPGGMSRIAAGGTNLYVVGRFTSAGDVAATNLVRWDGAQWHSLGYVPPAASGIEISAVTECANLLFIAERETKSFTAPGTNASLIGNSVRRWDGTSWSSVGQNLAFASDFQLIQSLAYVGSNLFVGGYFVATNPVAATNLLRWNGAAWHAVDFPSTASNPTIDSMAVSGTNLYVRGSFVITHASGYDYRRIARWDGSSWSYLGSGVSSEATTMQGRPERIGGDPTELVAAFGRDVFTSGYFTLAGGKSSFQFALWHEFPSVNLAPSGWLPNGKFGLRIIGSSGQTIRIQNSPDLAYWSDLVLVTPDSNDYEVQITTAPASARYYRALLVP